MTNDPIVLTSWDGKPSRAAVWTAAMFIVLGAAAFLVGLSCADQAFRQRCAGGVYAGPTFIIVGILLAFRTMWRGARGLEIRLDDEGLTLEGRFVPWSAVVAVGWSSGRRTGPLVQVRVRDVPGYEAPRERAYRIDHLRYRVGADVLMDAIVARAPSVVVFARDPDAPQRGR